MATQNLGHIALGTSLGTRNGSSEFENRHHSPVGWLSARKNLGGGAKDNRPLFFKTRGYCFYCSFYCFLTILGGKSRFGRAPPAPL